MDLSSSNPSSKSWLINKSNSSPPVVLNTWPCSKVSNSKYSNLVLQSIPQTKLYMYVCQIAGKKNYVPLGSKPNPSAPSISTAQIAPLSILSFITLIISNFKKSILIHILQSKYPIYQQTSIQIKQVLYNSIHHACCKLSVGYHKLVQILKNFNLYFLIATDYKITYPSQYKQI